MAPKATRQYRERVNDPQFEPWLTELASSAPAPGGGAAAAVSAALGAAMVSMVCNLTLGKKRYAASEPLMKRALERAEQLRAEALSLIEQDAAAFDAVARAYALPRGEARSAAIQSALPRAAAVPLRTAEVAADIVELAESICEAANPNVLSDVAVAALSAGSAITSAAVNVEVNVALLRDAEESSRLAARVATLEPAARRAEALSSAIRARIRGGSP